MFMMVFFMNKGLKYNLLQQAVLRLAYWNENSYHLKYIISDISIKVGLSCHNIGDNISSIVYAINTDECYKVRH